MRVSNERSGLNRRNDDSNSFARKLADDTGSKRDRAEDSGNSKGGASRPSPSDKLKAGDKGSAKEPEVFGGGPNPGDMGCGGKTPANDTGSGTPTPVEPDGGIGDGAGPIPTDPDDSMVTTLAIGEEDGGAPMPVEPDGGIGDGAGPIPDAAAGGTIKGTRGNDTLQGTDGDDLIKGKKGDDTITTGAGADTVRGGKGDDTITVTGSGDKKINGGKGHDTLELQGQASDYAVKERQNGSTVYTAGDGSRIVARNIESVQFVGGGAPMPVEPDGGIGDGAGPIPTDPDDQFGTTQALGEEDGGAPIPVEPDGGIGDGAGPIPTDPDDSMVTTLAIGEEDGGGDIPPPFDFIGTNGDDTFNGQGADETFSTGQGTDTVNAGGGDDRIVVNGTGNKTIDGGAGSDRVLLKGLATDYTTVANADGSTVYTSPDGSEISVRSVETIAFAEGPPPASDFVAFYGLEPNDLGATNLDVQDGTATLSGPGTDFTFTGVDASALASDGPITATGGSGTINGVETTAVPLSNNGDAVLTIGSGFGGTSPVSATFANGDTLNTTVTSVVVP